MDNLDFSILNAISKHQRIALDFSYSSDENLFFSTKAQTLGKAFLHYVKSYRSKPTRKSLLDRHSTEDGLCDIINEFYDKADVTDYNEADYAYDVSKLKQTYGETRLKIIKDRINAGNLTDVTGTIRSIEKEIGFIKAANGQRAYERKKVRDYVDGFRELYIEKSKNPELGKGLLTGYSFLDYIKNGLRPADLIIIAGETGAGKSIFMGNMAVQMWMQQNNFDTPKTEYMKGCNVTYFSLEMPYEDCFRRTMARLADVPEYGIRDAKLGKQEAKGVAEACRFIKNYPYELDIVDVPRGFSVEQLEVMIEEIKSEYTPDVIFIDYMGLMEDLESDADDWLKLGQMAGKIHEFARAHSIPVVTATQLNRIDPGHKKTESKSIGLHRIGRSSMIAHHATVIIQIESRPDEETHDDFIYHIIKNRHGQSGKSATIWKNFIRCSILDKPYDADSIESWQATEDISDDIAGILGLENEE